MKVLIVGAAGKVGTIIRPALEPLFECSYFDLRPVPQTQAPTIVGDVNNDTAVLEALKGVQTVVYLAMGTKGGDPQTVGDIDLAFNVNVRGAYRFLQHAMKAGVRRFVYASTLSVYKPRSRAPVMVESAPADTWEPYGLSKRVGEFLCQAAAVEYPDATVIALRLSSPTEIAEWPHKRDRVRKKRGSTYPQGPKDLARLFVAAVQCTKPGAHIIQTTGDAAGVFWSHQAAKELLGWEPRDE